MPGDFGSRMDELIEKVAGSVRGELVVDQVYAQYQHEGLDLRHPRGGQAKYLSFPLMQNHMKYVQNLADGLLDDGGKQAMINNMEDLSSEVYKYAPREFHDLRQSGHPIVKHDDRTIYDRPPIVHRLTREELRKKDEIRALGRRLGLW